MLRFDRHITFDTNIGRKQNRIRWKAEIASFPTRVGSISADTYEESYTLIKYIAKLRRGGHKVALCEQVEEANLVKDKRPVRRAVVRVYTPGTLVEDELLEKNENNYLAAVMPEAGQVGLAYLDLSTGEFRATELFGNNISHVVADELARIDPRE